MTRVLLVDDQDMIRQGLAAILSSHPDIEVVGQAATGESGVAAVATENPDVVLMDLRMPGAGGVEATGRIKAEFPHTRVLVLTTFDQDDNVLAAMRAGADGFLSKGAGPTELIDAVLGTAAGRRMLSDSAVNALVTTATATPQPPAADAAKVLEVLTAREREMVEAVVRGASNEEIAAELFLSPLTVKTHVNRAMTKLGARDRAQLVTIAVQAGLRP
ncbi:response regulator transcription factor [Actinomyces viscosus]|uniref:response regulator transcription factor n=1 Tax=Actinomyces viscosus TaxID=1656 RepID=UPI0028E1F06F|nr:response regulator transcription factor [Actinomyces viscosus]